MLRMAGILVPLALAFPAGGFALAGEQPAKTPETVERADGHAPDTYRFGGRFSLAAADTPGACETKCDLTGKCEAWSFLPAVGDASTRCELKYSIGKAVRRPGAVSGIAGKYRFDTIDMTTEDELAGGPAVKPGAPSTKPETMPAAGPALPAGSPKAPTVFRGSELDGNARIIKTN